MSAQLRPQNPPKAVFASNPHKLLTKQWSASDYFNRIFQLSIEWIVLQEHRESTWKRSMRWLERDGVGLRPNSTNISFGAEFTWRTSCITRHASCEPLVSSSSDAATLFAVEMQHTCCQWLRFPQPWKVAFAVGHSLRLKTEPSHTMSEWKG